MASKFIVSILDREKLSGVIRKYWPIAFTQKKKDLVLSLARMSLVWIARKEMHFEPTYAPANGHSIFQSRFLKVTTPFE